MSRSSLFSFVGGTKNASLAVLSDYLALMKPLIIVLLLITAMGGMMLAEQGFPPVSLVALVLVGGGLAAGGANTINQYLDRDIDLAMTRTRGRPIPGNRVPPRMALAFGLVLNVLAGLILAIGVNILSAVLALSATVFYVFVYTIWLKRTTPQNIVIGGAAGSIPPLVGWAAVTGGIGLPALYLFTIIFFWTPPHFWALSLLLKEDYAQAGVPMLPVVMGVKETGKTIFLYTVLLVALTLLFVTTQAVGWIYFIAALLLGIGFLMFAWKLLRSGGTRQHARTLYLYSLLYLALLFAAIMVDSLV